MEQLSLVSLVLDASIVVKLVMLILAIFSVYSWAIIFSKWYSLKKAKFETKQFLKQYYSTNSITSLFNQVANSKTRVSVAELFYSGLSEYNRLNKEGINNQVAITANLERALTASIDEELNNYEESLSILATFGSVSPYIGLFGTVWGIMHAFIGLGTTNQVSLASVAPGIAEALVATAMGLFVAIPAYMAYNKFNAEVIYLYNKMNKFGDEFLNLINRKLAQKNSFSVSTNQEL